MGHIWRSFSAARAIMLPALFAAVSTLVLAACGTGSVEEDAENSGDTVGQHATTSGSLMEDAPSASEVLFPKQKPLDGLPMSAGITGELILDDEGCIRIDSGGAIPDRLPLWPSYFELSAEGGELRILDGEGDFVARIGGRIDTGGCELQHGETKPRETFQVLRRAVGGDMARQLRDRCSAPYWLIGPGEDHIQ